MKVLVLLYSLAICGFSFAQFESWTSSDGRSADLAEPDAKRLEALKSPEEIEAEATGTASVLNEILDGTKLGNFRNSNALEKLFKE